MPENSKVRFDKDANGSELVGKIGCHQRHFQAAHENEKRLVTVFHHLLQILVCRTYESEIDIYRHFSADAVKGF